MESRKRKRIEERKRSKEVTRERETSAEERVKKRRKGGFSSRLSSRRNFVAREKARGRERNREERERRSWRSGLVGEERDPLATGNFPSREWNLARASEREREVEEEEISSPSSLPCVHTRVERSESRDGKISVARLREGREQGREGE